MSIDPGESSAQFLGADRSEGEFWQSLKTNLEAGRIRLIFVADEIPPGLRRIVEFLNGQMNPAEVLAVEVRQHIGSELKALAPTLIGQTATAQRTKSVGGTSTRKWDEASFFADLQAKKPDTVRVAHRIFDWAMSKASRIAWGAGTRSGSFVPVLQHNGVDHQLFAVYTYGTFETFFQYFAYKPPFDDEGLRLELLERLNRIPKVSLPRDGIARRPSFPLEILVEDGRTDLLLGVYDWVAGRIRAV